MFFFRKLSALLLLLLIYACQQDHKSLDTTKVFTLLTSQETGVSFNNTVEEDKDVNIYKYGYLYNGGGVGIGDINNDGLADIYLSSTQGRDKLYINKGDFKFEDISTSSGIDKYDGYKAGVNFIDINNDGWTDIYVCRQGMNTSRDQIRNLLFVNNKDNTFTESAKAYGIDDDGYGTQSGFFDMDNDGDLDLYILNHPGEFSQPLPNMIEKIRNPKLNQSDKLYRNDDGKFKDITIESGILNYGYGLGLALGDMNQDGLIDIYVANDFAPHDYYYVNQGNGKFKESIKEYFPHCSYFSMGCDLVDLNNDKALDLFVVEMLSESNKRQKTNMAPMDMDRFSYQVNNGLHYQYMRNNMHINNGNGYFSDVAYYTGLDKTDWSWGTLFGDYDNDGDDDLIVVNGYLKDTQDKDFNNTSNDLAKKYNNRLSFDQIAPLLKSTPIRNYAFENQGKLKFKKVSNEWGFNFKGFSNGVATGDLDNDGDLDIVVNNINDEANIYRNNTNAENFVGLIIKGPEKNRSALNVKIELETNLGSRFKEFQVSRGFQSSVDNKIHFGLAENESVVNVKITWPDGNFQINEIVSGIYNTIKYAKNGDSTARKESPTTLQEVSKDYLKHLHVEQYYNDYKTEVLLPHQLSQLGPALSKGDVNGDGLEDLFIGGANQYEGTIYLQQKDGTFKGKTNKVFEDDKVFEDVASTFFDLDSDGDLDLIVGSGGNQFPIDSPMYYDRLYINNGEGDFVKNLNNIPQYSISTGVLVSSDFDNDGDEDIFVGGRLTPGKYPQPSNSLLLVNESGKLIDKTQDLSTEFNNLGMVTDAVWCDYDNDNDLDLIVVGEWMDITFFNQNQNLFTKDTNNPLDGESNIGWWNTIEGVDLDDDGDVDFILGNLGQNYKYQASKEKPFIVYSKDFDDNGTMDIVLGYHSDGDIYPVRGLQCSSEQIPDLKKKFPTYDKFGGSNIYQVYGEELKEALSIEATEFNSIILRNIGDGKFKKEVLPYQAQLAPVQDVEVFDYNNDGIKDIVIAGNWFVAEIETPRADNGTGLILVGTKNGHYTPLSVAETGFFANKDVRKITIIKRQEPIIVVANNNNLVQVFK